MKNKETNLHSNIVKFIRIMNKKERRGFWLVSVSAFFLSIFEMVGVASIFPFMSVVAEPSIVDSNDILRAGYEILAFENHNKFLIFLGCVTLVCTVAALLMRTFHNYYVVKFSQDFLAAFSSRIMTQLLSEDYRWHVNRSMSATSQTLLSEIDQITNSGVMPLINLISGCLVVLGMLTLIVFLNPTVSFFVATIGVSFYGITYILVKKIAHEAGKVRHGFNQSRYTVVQNLASGIKTVKIYRLEKTLADTFAVAASGMAKAIISLSIIKQLPRNVLEFSAITTMIVAIIYLIWQHGPGQVPIASLSVYALAGFRIIPAIQTVFASCATLKFAETAVDEVYADFQSKFSTEPKKRYTDLKFEIGDISVKNVSVKFNDTAVLQNITTFIKKGSKTAIVGKSGSGKSTLLDLISGLTSPDTGQICIGANTLNDSNRLSWQKQLSYAPQSVFLLPDTVSQNITLADQNQKIDESSLKSAIESAHLNDIFSSCVESGLDEKIGDGGRGLSGGQKQRVGIARALYRNADLIILDECTSSLDARHGEKMINDILKKNPDKTIIMATHSPGIVKLFESVIKLEGGKISEQGTYKKLYLESKSIKPISNN